MYDFWGVRTLWWAYLRTIGVFKPLQRIHFSHLSQPERKNPKCTQYDAIYFPPLWLVVCYLRNYFKMHIVHSPWKRSPLKIPQSVHCKFYYVLVCRIIAIGIVCAFSREKQNCRLMRESLLDDFKVFQGEGLTFAAACLSLEI